MSVSKFARAIDSNASKSCLLVAFCLLLSIAPLTRVFALPIFLDVAKSTYGFKENGVIAGAKCNLCHNGTPNAQHLNVYGKDVQGVLLAASGQSLTAKSLHAIDLKDSDGDGFTNGDEFKSDTLPGDSASKPPGTPPNNAKPTQFLKSAGAFSLQSTLLARNAQHPVLVHFPIALFLFSLFLDGIGWFKKNSSLHLAAYFNLIAAAVSSIFSILTGILAWRIKLSGTPLEGDLRLHLILAITSSVLLCTLWAVRAKTRSDDKPFANLYWVLAVIASIAIAITGHLGGVVSGVAG